MSESLDKSEFEAVLKARQELGSEMEPALVESFTQKVLAEIRRQQGQGTGPLTRAQGQQFGVQPARPSKGSTAPSLTLAIISLVLAIPLTGIASSVGLLGMIVAWAGIAAVNVAAAMGIFKNDR